MSLRERDQKVVWHPYTQSGIFPENIPIVSGKGALLFDESGKQYIDAISSWWVNIHGHANDKINHAVSQQLSKLEQVIFAGFTHEPAVQLAEKLISVQPHFGKVFYSDNGSTAVEVALKIALQFRKNRGISAKQKILAFEHSYHGDTFGAMSLSGRSLFTEHYNDFLFDVTHIPIPDKDNIEECISKIEIEIAAGNVTAFIYEPLVLGSGGMLMYSQSDLQRILSLLHKHDVLLIADEVMTGFGRTGPLFASDTMEVKPDMMCLSKGLTGGYLPMGITMVSDRIHEEFVSHDFAKTLFHGHSFTGNLLSCAAANASFDISVSEECAKSRKFIADSHLEYCESLRGFLCVKNLRTCGTILAFDLDVNDAGYASVVRREILSFFIAKGILIRPLGNVIYLLPPYCITKEQLQFCYSGIMEFLNGFEFRKQK